MSIVLKRGRGRPRIRPLLTTDPTTKIIKYKRASGNWSPKVATDKEKLLNELLSLQNQEKAIVTVKMNLHKVLQKLVVEEMQLTAMHRDELHIRRETHMHAVFYENMQNQSFPDLYSNQNNSHPVQFFDTNDRLLGTNDKLMENKSEFLKYHQEAKTMMQVIRESMITPLTRK